MIRLAAKVSSSLFAAVPWMLSCGSDTVGAPVLDACEQASQGSQGCSFSVTRLLHQRVNETDPDAVIVSNPSSDASTRVQIVRGGFAEEPVLLEPGGVHIFDIDERAIGGESTAWQSGAAIRILAEDPVAAYLMAPMTNRTANEGSLLLPDAALGDTYVVSAYGAFSDPNHPLSKGEPSYFTIIGQEDGTTVHFWPPIDTAAGDGIAAVVAGGEGRFELDAGDVARIAAVPTADISGTVVQTDAPVWVAGGVGCAYVPISATGHCDHLQEVLRPIDHWATDYPAVPSPPRANEPHIWRVYAGAANVTVTTEPQTVPFVLEQLGDWVEIVVPHAQVGWFHADGPILPMQYLVGASEAEGRGDPSMIQAIPTKSWMRRYVVSTGLRYSEHYLQIVRLEGEGEAFVDGVLVEDYRAAQGLEIADVLVDEGSHVVTSTEPIGLSLYGYSNGVDGTKYTSYAIPGGFGD